MHHTAVTKRKEKYVIPFGVRVRSVGSVVAGTIIAFGLLLFASNFVIDGKFIIRGGTVVVEDAPTGTQILVDSKLRGEVNKDGNMTIKRVARGKRILIATRGGHWPWVRNIDVQAGETAYITPLLIPQEAAAKIVESAPDATPLPGRTTPIILQETALWADGNAIYSQLGVQQKPVAVFTADYPVRSLALYPNRTDTLLVAAGDMIFALDIEEGEARNFLPVYKSKQPSFAIDEESGTIFVKDDGKILELKL